MYFPAGVYHIRNSLVVNGHSIHLRGDPSGSVLVSAGAFDTISINPGSPEQYDNSIENLSLREHAKTGGKAIVAQRVGRFQISGVILESPFDGIHVHNFNTVRIDRTRVVSPRGTFGCWLSGGGPSEPGRSDVIEFYDTVFGGDPQPSVPPTTPPPDRHGLIIDGAVYTVSAHKIYFIHIEGAALWIRNSLHDRNPEFATIFGLEAEFMRYEGIRIECGQRFYFTDALLHGSRQRSNIVVSDRVNTTAFHGGFSTGGHLAGIDIFGRQVGVYGMDFLANSGVAQGAWAGIVLEAQSRMVTITGNRCGDPDNRTQSVRHSDQFRSRPVRGHGQRAVQQRQSRCSERRRNGPEPNR